MEAPPTLWTYLGRLCGITYHAVKDKWKGAILLIIGVFVGAVVSQYFKLIRSDQLLPLFLANGAAWAAISAIVYFLYHFLRAPFKLDQERYRTIESLSTTNLALNNKLERLMPRLHFQGIGSAIHPGDVNHTLHNLAIGNENHDSQLFASNVRAEISYQFGDGKPYSLAGTWSNSTLDRAAISIAPGSFERLVFLYEDHGDFYVPVLLLSCINAGQPLEKGPWKLFVKLTGDNCEGIEGTASYRLGKDSSLAVEEAWSFKPTIRKWAVL